jgi:hypothetical protein
MARNYEEWDIPVINKTMIESKIKELDSYHDIHNQLFWDNVKNLKDRDEAILLTIINCVHELNRSCTCLIRTDMNYWADNNKLVPIMIIRALLDYCMTLKGYLLYPNKEVYLRHYRLGNPLNRLKIEGQALTTNYLKNELDKDFGFVSALYNDCCDWVHSSYNKGKSIDADDQICIGRYGFRGKIYGYKLEDFIDDDYINGIEPLPEYDYEEEFDIVNYIIEVNKIIVSLLKQIIKRSVI